MAEHELFSEAQPLEERDAYLVELYERYGIPTDRLLHSQEFNAFVNELVDKGDDRSEDEIARRLLNLRKAGRLPRLVHVERKYPDYKNAFERAPITTLSITVNAEDLSGEIIKMFEIERVYSVIVRKHNENTYMITANRT